MARKTGKELRKEYRELLDKTKAMQNRIVKRAEDLIGKYPHVAYGKAKWKDDRQMTVGDYQRYYRVTPEIGLKIIEYIEQWIADNHPHRQTTIDFN